MTDKLTYVGNEVGLATAVGDSLVRKQILPRNKAYKWPGQKGRTLNITDSVITDLVKNFKAGVVDVVPFFKVNDKNQHVEDPEASRGKVVDLIATDKGLDAIIQPVDEDARKAILSTGLGASAGIRFGYETHDTGANVGAVLRHVAWTPEPWIPGMEPFGEVSLSGESYEAVFLSAEDTADDDDPIEGGEMNMDPKELQAAIKAAVDEAVKPVMDELEQTRTALQESRETVAALSASITESGSRENSVAVRAELDAMVEAGLPPAIADLASPILTGDGGNEVELSSGDKTTVGEQVRTMLRLFPKVDFSEKGEAGVAEGYVALSAEQVKELGFKVEGTKEDDPEKAELSADQESVKGILSLVPNTGKEA